MLVRVRQQEKAGWYFALASLYMRSNCSKVPSPNRKGKIAFKENEKTFLTRTHVKIIFLR
jgi:hypothetical protein